MELTVLGSGDASNGAGRAHSCYWLEATGSKGVTVDFGGTALKQLKAFGKDPADLEAVFLTHLHGDHIGGLPYLLIQYLYPLDRPPRTAPLTIVGPTGTEARVMALVGVTYGSLASKEWPFSVTWIELAPGEARDGMCGFRVEAFAADHMSPPEQPLCLRLTALGGERVAFSGDTRMCDGLRSAAQGVDLLVAECTGLAPPSGAHTTWEDWRVELPRIGAKRVLLTHLGAPVREAVDRLLAEAPAGPPFGFAEDGLSVTV